MFYHSLINSNHYPFHHSPHFQRLHMYRYILMKRFMIPVPQSVHYLTFAIVVRQSDPQFYFSVPAPHVDLFPHPSNWLPHPPKYSKLSEQLELRKSKQVTRIASKTFSPSNRRALSLSSPRAGCNRTSEYSFKFGTNRVRTGSRPMTQRPAIAP